MVFLDLLYTFNLSFPCHMVVSLCLCLHVAVFFLFVYLCFWLCWVFVDTRRASLIVVNRGYSLLWCIGFSLQWLLLFKILQISLLWANVTEGTKLKFLWKSYQTILGCLNNPELRVLSFGIQLSLPKDWGQIFLKPS